MEDNVSYGDWLRLCARDDAGHVELLLEGLERNDGTLDADLVLDAWSHRSGPSRCSAQHDGVALFRSVGFGVDGSVVSALSDVVELHRRVA